jgi:hypothetical protein
VPEGIGRQVGLPMGSGLTRSGLRSFGLILTDHLCGIRHTRHIGLEDENIHSFLKNKEEAHVPEGIGRQVGLPMGSGLTRSGLRSFGLILTDHLCGIRHTRHIGLEDKNIHSFLKNKEEAARARGNWQTGWSANGLRPDPVRPPVLRTDPDGSPVWHSPHPPHRLRG